MMANKTLKIKDIEIPKGKRVLDKEVVAKLSSSILEVGLLHPIIVSKDMKLIAGQHRLEAYKQNHEVMIEARVVDITFNDDMVATIELDENDARAELNIRDKVSLVEEIARLRDARAISGGVRGKNGKFTVSDPNETDTVKVRDSKRDKKRQTEAQEAGFKNRNEASRAKRIVKEGTEELIDAVNDGEVSVSGGYEISKLPKEEQNAKVELAKNNDGRVAKTPKAEKNIVKEKKIKVKEQDKFGSYVNVKIYTGDLSRTSDNIAKCFGKGFESAYNLLLHEMVTARTRGKNRNEDLAFSSYSYGTNSLSDGEVADIKALLAEGMYKKDIEELYNISSYLIDIVENIKDES